MGRILSIDIGQKRIGLAVTDPSGIIATPLDTVHVKDIWSYLEKYINDNGIKSAIIGNPLQNNGKHSDAMRYVTQFVEKFRVAFPGTTVTMYDERFTSVMAKNAILESGVNRKTRRDKSLVDMVSATILLQSYMETNDYKNRSYDL